METTRQGTYSLQRMVGRGSFGQVFAAHKVDGQRVAVKRTKVGERSSTRVVSSVLVNVEARSANEP